MGLQDRLKNNLTGNFQTNTSDTLTDIQKRTQNMLVNGEEQVKKAVEQGQIKVTDTEKKIYDAAPEVDVDTSSQDNNLGDAWYTPANFANLETPTAGPMMFLGENFGNASADVVSDGGEAVDKAVNNFLPEDIGKNLGLALYGILAVAAIAVFVYILSLLKPIFQIGANVSDK